MGECFRAVRARNYHVAYALWTAQLTERHWVAQRCPLGRQNNLFGMKISPAVLYHRLPLPRRNPQIFRFRPRRMFAPPLLSESDARNSEAYTQVSFFNRLGDAIRSGRDRDPFGLRSRN
jgi:hypothetical protein